MDFLQSYSSPDASFQSSWNERLLFHFTVYFKLPVRSVWLTRWIFVSSFSGFLIRYSKSCNFIALFDFANCLVKVDHFLVHFFLRWKEKEFDKKWGKKSCGPEETCLDGRVDYTLGKSMPFLPVTLPCLRQTPLFV